MLHVLYFFKKRSSGFPSNSGSTVLQLLQGNLLKRFLQKLNFNFILSSVVFRRFNIAPFS